MAENGLQLFNKTITKAETKNYLEGVLGKKAASFSNNIVALVANDANLQKCDPFTIMFAGIKATALDLPLDKNLGFAYVIPYENRKKGVTEAQFQIGWRGYVQLAIRSGQFAAINVTDVREGELEDFDLLTGEVKFKRVEEREKKPVIGYAAYFRLTNGFSKTLYMTKGEIDAHANKYSQTYASKNDFVRKSSKWATDFDAMAKKNLP